MPRKVDPHWGEDGFDDIEPFSLAPEGARSIAAYFELPIISQRASDLLAAVEDIGATYHRWRGRGAEAFTRVEARQAIEDLLELEQVDYATLTGLNERAFDCVFNALLMIKPAPISDGETVLAALTSDQLDETVIRGAMHNAVAKLKSTKGPERQGDLAWAVAELCHLFEEQTGEKASHSSKGRLLAYDAEPQSKAGQFVKLCFSHIDPKIHGSQLSRAMRQFIEHRT